VLDTNAIPYAALKGASLSLEFYDEPALRPMRDLDIMVLPGDAERAYEKLKAAGFEKLQGKGNYGLEYKHHLPPLRNAQGVILELHHRIAPCDWSGSQPLGNQLVENARDVDFQGHTIRMAHPTDTYIHLVVHAAFHNLFDNGPNLLSDVVALESTGLIDRGDVETFARSHGLVQSIALVEALVAHFRGSEDVGVPEKMIEQAADLMTQNPEEHWQRFLLRKRRNPVGRILGGVGRAFRPNAFDLSEIAGKDVSGLAALRHYPAWLYERAKVYLGAELKSGLDSEAAGDVELEAWLERPELTQRDAKA
ncbi:MAG: nucleotidyltransferase family protein, partial [Pseudomonadota bacterium]